MDCRNAPMAIRCVAWGRAATVQGATSGVSTTVQEARLMLSQRKTAVPLAPATHRWWLPEGAHLLLEDVTEQLVEVIEDLPIKFAESANLQPESLLADLWVKAAGTHTLRHTRGHQQLPLMRLAVILANTCKGEQSCRPGVYLPSSACKQNPAASVSLCACPAQKSATGALPAAGKASCAQQCQGHSH